MGKNCIYLFITNTVIKKEIEVRPTVLFAWGSLDNPK